MIEEAAAKLDVDAARRVVQRIGSQILQNDVEEADQDEARDNHKQGRSAFVDEHLVDGDLEE